MRVLLLAVLAVAASAGETCFGKKPEYDSQCATQKTEAACEKQIACLWGDKSRDQCFAKNPKDPIFKDACAQLKSEKDCDAQFACEWRSATDLAEWVKSVSSAVEGLQMSRPSIPSSITIATPTVSSSHDHRQTSVADLSATLSAWETKYRLPDQALSALRALVAIEATDFKFSHQVIRRGDASMSEIAAAGRNYNGHVSLAFVFGSADASLTKKPHSVTCTNHDCTKHAYNKPTCDCQVDGTYFGPITPGFWAGCMSDSDCHDPSKFTIPPSRRALTSGEADAVQKDLQSTLYDKVKAEATLLENELKYPGDGHLVV